MVSLDTVRKLALTFPEAVEQPHFEKASFRVKKKIFATLDAKNMRCVVKLSALDQSTFSSFDKTIIYPIKNAWGKQGWTIIELKKVPKKLIEDILITAYCEVASDKLAKLLRPE
jgi:predicted DNA-binding protein (MmcQ/YjbR family)